MSVIRLAGRWMTTKITEINGDEKEMVKSNIDTLQKTLLDSQTINSSKIGVLNKHSPALATYNWQRITHSGYHNTEKLRFDQQIVNWGLSMALNSFFPMYEVMGCHVMFQNNYPANPHIHAWDPRINRHEGVDLESPNIIRDKVIVSVDWHKMLNYNATIQHFLKINSRMDNEKIFSTPMNTVDNNTVKTLMELHRYLGNTKVDNANVTAQPSDDPKTTTLNPINTLTQTKVGENENNHTTNTDSSEKIPAEEEVESESSLVPENLLKQTIVGEKEKKLYASIPFSELELGRLLGTGSFGEVDLFSFMDMKINFI